MANDTSVATRTTEAAATGSDLALMSALWGGTTTMRLAASEYLPRHEAEPESEYDMRLESSFLFNMLKKTARSLAGKPFGKPMVLPESLPEIAMPWLTDADNRGTTLAQWARRFFEKTIRDGYRFIIVDVPKAVAPDGTDRRLRKNEEAAQGIRPYLVEVDARQFLGGRVERVNGTDVITQFRYAENTREPDGEFGEKLVKRVRVLSPGQVDVYVATASTDGGDSESAWRRESSHATSINFVPVVPVIPDPLSEFTGQSPLLDLAWVNVEHWQSTSDQRNILHVTRVPIKYAFGFSADDDITIGAGVVVTNPNPTAKFGYVEHGGKAMESGVNDIEHLENRARVLGMNLIVEQPAVAVTATEVNANKGESDSELAAMTRDFGGDLGTAIDMMLVWMKQPPTGQPVQLYTNFSIPARAAADVEVLRKVRMDKQITQQTFLTELKTRELLSEDLDVEAETTATQSEQTASMLAMVAGEFDAQTGNDNNDDQADA